MHVTRHLDPDAFLAAAAPMSARGEASASFFIGWAHAVKRTPPKAAERVYFATFADGEMRGAAIQRDEGPVLIGQSDPPVAVAFAEDLATDWPDLQGVSGAPKACAAFAQRWYELTGREFKLRVRLRQHSLTAVNKVPSAPGAPRMATEADIDWLIEHGLAFVTEAGLPDSSRRVREHIVERAGRGDYRIWEDGDRVAYAGFGDAAPDFARIAPVYTLPHGRRRGYATALVAALSRELLRRGKCKLFLTTDVANPTSNAIYARIGFRVECEEYGLDFITPRA